MSQSELAARYQQIMRRIAAAAAAPLLPEGQPPAKPRKITLVAVSKGQPAEAILALYHLGHRDFGENYVQELMAKAKALAQKHDCRDIRWHFIGHLQTNKVKTLIPHVHAVHSVDSVKLATELAKRWGAAGREGRLPVFAEVNLEGEATKSGLAAADAPGACAQIAALPELDLRGLMCIPAPGSGGDPARSPFLKLRELEAACRPNTQGELSMGMSDDFETAIRFGATHVRVGTALFGPRVAKPGASPADDPSEIAEEG